jgi:hypothetical protein
MSFKYLGKNKRGNDEKLATKLKVSVDDIIGLKENKTRYITNEKTGDILKVDLSNSPLLLRQFGIKKFNNKLILGGAIKKNINVSSNPIELNRPITGVIHAIILITWTSSGNIWNREVFIEVNNQILNNQEAVEEMVMQKFFEENQSLVNNTFGVMNDDISVEINKLEFLTKNNVSLEFDNMKLRGVHLDLSRIYGENVNLNISNDDNCVKNYLLKIYKKISPKTIEKLGDEDGITPLELYDFCSKFNIKMILFNIEGEIVSQNIPENKNKNHKSLIGIAYNNHFYPLKNKELYRVPRKEIKQTIYTPEIDEKMIDILNKNDYPTNISIYQNEINSIQVGDVVYHKNEDYNTCYDILNSLGLKDKMTHFVNKKNISKTIEKLFLKSSVDSFFPYSSGESGFSYLNDKFDNNKNTITLDHNKHYSDALRKLKKLIIIDIKTAKHIENPTELNCNYFYIAKPAYCSILMPKTGFYSYDFLKYCEKEGVEFTLLEGIQCEYKTNYYTDMINVLYKKLSNEHFKFVVNCMIGSFEKQSHKKEKMKFLKIANEDETSTSDKYSKKLNDEYNIIYDLEKSIEPKIFNRVPIRVQVLCEARKIVYEKIKELKLTRDDIKQIRTDAITFKYEKKIKSGVEIGEWKEQESKPYKSTVEIHDINISFKLNSVNILNQIYIDYAGSGKTYYIINELLNDMNDFIVLSPSHASIKEYRLNNINCNVIQKYTLSGNIPEEQNIIIDEVGMLDSMANNLLVKCAILGKTIYSFGDFKQLKPVNNEPCSSDIYLNYLYGNIKKLGTNYRNNFTFKYYDKLCGMKDINMIGKEIIKYNTVYDEAETIITYTNDVRIKYNNMMCEKLKIKFGDIGCKIVCKSNDLKDKDIYNNFYYIIKDVVEDVITIYDDVSNIYISKDELKKYFDLGYCRTLYNIQGESLKSFHFAMEDLQYIDGRALYTLISRLKK